MMKITIVQPDGTFEVRDFNADEIAAHEIAEANEVKQKEKQIARNLARQAVLDKLSLTADEAALLLG